MIDLADITWSPLGDGVRWKGVWIYRDGGEREVIYDWHDEELLFDLFVGIVIDLSEDMGDMTNQEIMEVTNDLSRMRNE